MFVYTLLKVPDVGETAVQNSKNKLSGLSKIKCFHFIKENNCSYIYVY